MATWKYWKDENYVREYEDGKIEDLNQSLKKHGISMDKEMSKTYCYCCGNHVKHHLETVLGKKLDVEVITSALMSMGKKSCRFVLTELE